MIKWYELPEHFEAQEKFADRVEVMFREAQWPRPDLREKALDALAKSRIELAKQKAKASKKWQLHA